LAFSCSVGEKTFKDVVPSAIETIGHLRFDTVFSLARLISIHEHERSQERKRLLMMDPRHVFITLSGVRKAFLFFKKCCDHVFHSLATHDGSFLALPHDGGTGLPVDQLNEANNEGVRYAKANNWDDVENDEEPLKPLVILPDSFSLVDAFFKVQPNVHRRMYRDLGEIASILERSESSCCVLVGPTSDISIPKKEWCRLASVLAAAARNGTKILAVAPPRGDKAYERNRIDMNEAL
uniref:BK_channel_a domain-containing protein n=1 Tax=Heligmosomoides polygyrus TaxID=6339 RepID=A0A183FBA1_HELPZ